MNLQRATQVRQIILEQTEIIAPQFGYDPEVIATTLTALAHIESTFNATARVKPPHTARGLLQINNVTQKEAEQELGLPASGDTKIFDASYNAYLATYMFCKRLKRCGDNIRLAVVAYNQGNCSKAAQLRAAGYLLKYDNAMGQLSNSVSSGQIKRTATYKNGIVVNRNWY